LAMALMYGVTAEEFKRMILELGMIVAEGEYDRYSKVPKEGLH